jgi:hypothetical protein
MQIWVHFKSLDSFNFVQLSEYVKINMTWTPDFSKIILYRVSRFVSSSQKFLQITFELDPYIKNRDDGLNASFFFDLLL